MMKHLIIQKTMRWIGAASLLFAVAACDNEEGSLQESRVFTPEKFEINIEKDHYGQRENRAAKADWVNGDEVRIWASKEASFTAMHQNGEWTVSIPTDLQLSKEGGTLKAAYASASKASTVDGIQCNHGDIAYTEAGNYTVSDDNVVTVTLNLNQHPVGYITFRGVGEGKDLSVTNMKFVEAVTYTEDGFQFAFNEKSHIALTGEEDGTVTCYVLPTEKAVSGSDLTVKVKYGIQSYARTFTGKSLTAGKGVSMDSPGAAADKWEEIEDGISYTADDLKIGDYFYSDGTTSDGGLRNFISGTGAQTWESPKPEPVSGKKLIGIVFTTDEERISEHEKAKGWNHGLVISTNWVYTPTGSQDLPLSWYNGVRDETEIGIPNIVGADYKEQYQLCDNNIDGYYYNQQIRTEREADYNKVWTYGAFYQAGHYTIAAPDNTSGWYVPSVGQMLDVYRAAFGFSLNEQQNSFNKYNTDNNGFMWNVGASANIVNSMNAFMSKDGKGIQGGFWYLTSSAFNDSNMIAVMYNQFGYIQCTSTQTKKSARARFILSF